MFTRSFTGDLDALLEAPEPICLVRFGDGEIALIDGIDHQSADAWRTKGPAWIRGDVIRSLRNDAPGWCVGLPAPCCLKNGVRIHPAIRIPQERVTFSTLFLHANLRSFPRVITRFADAITVGSWFGDIRVPADGVTVPWDIDACVAEIIAADRDVLLAAGPCSNVIALRYWERVPESDKHFVLDVGSALDVAHGRTTRHFHTAMADHFCKWGLPGSLTDPRARLQRVVARPTQDLAPASRREATPDTTIAQRPEREPMPRAAPKLEQRIAMPKAEIRMPALRLTAPRSIPTEAPTADPAPSPRRDPQSEAKSPTAARGVTRPSRSARPPDRAKPIARTAPRRAEVAEIHRAETRSSPAVVVTPEPTEAPRVAEVVRPGRSRAADPTTTEKVDPRSGPRRRTTLRPKVNPPKASAEATIRTSAALESKTATVRPRVGSRATASIQARTEAKALATVRTPARSESSARETKTKTKQKPLVIVRDRDLRLAPVAVVADTIVPSRASRPSMAVVESRPSGGVRRPLELHARTKPTTMESPHREQVIATTPIRMQSRAAIHVVDPYSVKGDAIAVVVTKRPWLAGYVGRMLAWQSLCPSQIVICSAGHDYDTSPIKNALPDVPVVFVRGGQAASLGELRNTAMEAASSLSSTAILCTIDDDDCYGVHYLAGIVDAWQRHPIALVVGLGSFETRAVDAPPSEALIQRYRARAGLRASVGGATISIPSKVWREREDLRYPAVACGEDIELLKIAQQENRVVGAYFGDFVALRYSDPAHAHTSANQGLPGTAR